MVGRIASLALIVSGVLFTSSEFAAPGSYSRIPVLVLGLSTVGSGIAAWWAPWERMGRWAVLTVVPFAFVSLDLAYVYAERNAFDFAVGYMLIFALIGLSLPRWTALRLAPLFVAAYLVPLIGTPGRVSSIGVGSAIYVVPICVLLGEAIAWGMHRYALAQGELAESASSIHRLFDQAPIGITKLDLDGRFLEVNKAFGEILGYAPGALVGAYLRDLTHPDDRDVTEGAVGDVLSNPHDRIFYEKRYLHADGHVVWAAVNGSVVRDPLGQPQFLVGQVEDITERRALREELALGAVTDTLTGLPNRMLFMEHLDVALERAETNGRHIALLFLDVDRFKMVNDGIGHDAGDRLLRHVGQRLQGALRPGDFLARFGGDEFTVLCEVAGEDEVIEVVNRLRRSMATPIHEGGLDQFVTLSIGVALSTSATMLPSLLLRSADIAMYQAKRSGPGRYVVFAEHDDDIAGHSLRTSNELHRAIQESQLVMHYQPFVDLDQLTVVGTEALVRWQHPERGLLPPSEFIDLAEECGLIVDLGTWVLRESCRQGSSWVADRLDRGVPGPLPTVSVNISPQQLAEDGFAELVSSILDETALPPDQLYLEITEGAVLRDPPAAIAILRTLRDRGVHLAIDDFGTGYSSLSYLKKLPVEALKIDRSFIEHLETDPDDRAIVEAIVALGRTLGLEVVAEGIERPGQAVELAIRNCHLAQGYLYARPTDPSDIGPSLPTAISDWGKSARPLAVRAG
ncbi:MAG: EAL domain-containing protein [Acidimicrobiales bacterium]